MRFVKRAAGYLFENIAGNQSLQFDSNLKAYVEALTNLISKTRVTGWGLVGWPSELALSKDDFRPDLCWVNFLDFYSTQSIFILCNLLLLRSISSFIRL